VKDKKARREQIYMGERIDLEGFVSSFFNGVTWVFGFSYEYSEE
jgi:hypothetical protein